MMKISLQKSSNDTGIDGEPIRISRDLGTIQRGRTFTEAVGTMCHEYGHVLGLPDLFNTDFLQKEEALPEEDSAGIGAWGLMGWGALGWNGDDGPNSLCAWSRVALGWTEVVEVVAPEQEIRMEPVGAGGKVIKVPLTEQEYFLIEYRTRTGTYYDRHIPGEGLLIWHISWKPSEGRRPARVLVDLECADGRWLDAGYPLGRQPDSRHGGDNLDFWAHDPAYAEQYGGNLGDSTDPFDGMQYQRFTPDTNPDAYSDDGQLSAHIENIRFEKGVAIADIQTRPLLINVRDLFLSDLDGNQITVSGEELIVAFKLINNGGYQARDLRVELHSDDPWIEIVQPEARFGDLSVGKETTATGEEGFPRFRFTNDFIGTHTATLFLDIYASNTSVARHEFTVSGISPRMEVQEVDVLDSQGNGPGRAQSGGFIRLGLTMDIKRVSH